MTWKSGGIMILRLFIPINNGGKGWPSMDMVTDKLMLRLSDRFVGPEKKCFYERSALSSMRYSAGVQILSTFVALMKIPPGDGALNG